MSVIISAWLFSSAGKLRPVRQRLVSGCLSSISFFKSSIINKPSKKTTAKDSQINHKSDNATIIITPTNKIQKEITKENSDFLLEATELDLDKLKSYGLPIIIDFGAETCIPCREMAPILTELNTEYKGKVIIKFVDISKYRKLIGDFPLEVIPTQFFFDKNGKPFVPKDSEEMRMDLYEDRSGKHVYTAHKGGMTKELFVEILNQLEVK